MGLLRLGVFYLQERLAVGGNAEVWRAVYPPSSLAVAVKLLREPVDRAAVAREARAVATLLHPSVVRIVDQGEVRPSIAMARPDALLPHQPYLVMELGDASLWARPPQPGWAALHEVLGALLDGLAHAHARGVVHLDLKPSNVLWVERRGAPRVAIADFGLARVAASSGPSGAGTPRYMAPEQHGDGLDVGPWTDLYALGVMARELAFTEDGRRRFPLPDGVDGWLARLTDARVPYRWLTAAEARYALDALGPAPDPPDPDRVPPVWSSADATRDVVTAPSGVVSKLVSLPDPTHTTVQPVGGYEALSVIDSQEAIPPPLRPPLPASWRESIELGPIHVVGAGLGLYGFRALPIVGREAERDELWRALSRVVGSEDERSHALLLTGPAGVGKTTLAEWIARRASEVVGASVPRVHMREGRRPGAALFSASRRWMGCAHAYTSQGVREALQRSLPRLAGRVDPDELETLTRANSVSAHSNPSPVERRRAAVRFTAFASRRRPVVILLDDLQWDEETMRFLQELLRAPGRVLVVATVALDEGMEPPERLSALLRHESVTEVPIGPLSPTDHARLVRELLGLSDQLAERVEARTSGNPAFAVQLVRDWASRGLLEVRKGALWLPADAEEELPDDVHDMWTRRVARITDGDRSERLSLALAAVLGEEVSVDAWRAAAASMGFEVDDAMVHRLLRSHLMIDLADGAELRLAHPMMRESLLRSARESRVLPALHSACADTLRPRFDAGETGLAERLALHLREAQRESEALPMLLESARSAMSAGRLDDALELLDSDAALREALDDDVDPRGACEAQILRASALNRMGRLAQAAGCAARALSAIGDGQWRDLEALALHELGYTDYHRGKGELAMSHLGRAVEVMEELHAYAPLARCLRVRGDLAHSRGEYDDARRDFERALEVSRQIDDPTGIASSLLGLSLPGVGDSSYAQEARRIFEELGHCSGACTAINTLAEAARSAGRLDEAEELYRRARQWARMGGVSQHEHICGLNIALTMLHGDRFEEAFVESELGASMTELLGQRLVQYMLEVVAVCAAVGAERYGDARQHLEHALDLQARVDHADEDIAWAARRACEMALDADQDALAADVMELAREEHRRLDRGAALAALEERLIA